MQSIKKSFTIKGDFSHGVEFTSCTSHKIHKRPKNAKTLKKPIGPFASYQAACSKTPHKITKN